MTPTIPPSKHARRRSSLIGLALAVAASAWLAGCRWDSQRGRGAKDETAQPPAATARGVESVCLPECRQAPPCQELCSPQRRVSTAPGSCKGKLPKGWVRRRLTDDLGSAEGKLIAAELVEQGGELEPVMTDGERSEAQGLARDAQLDDVCVYEWTGKGEPTSFPAGSVPDCVVAPTAPAGPGDLKAETVDEQELVTEIVRQKRGTLVPPGREGEAPVMIAVVDTAPRYGNASVSARHGRAMAAIANDVACGPEARTCVRRVHTFLGLPRVWGSAAPQANGGYYGYQSDLTRGVLEALAAFEVWNGSRAEGRGKLVLNLSVGWEPACDPRGAALVRRALALATARGALVLAATGNRGAGSCATGSTAPAAWGSESVATDVGMVPLLYAVTPVAESGGSFLDLATFRPGSNTRIAARGFMVATDDEHSSPRRVLGPYSGSSVATAVASGVAALVWSGRPELSPREVMDVLWKTGEPRPVLADSYYGSAAPEQHVVSACRALELPECESSGGDDASVLSTLWGNRPTTRVERKGSAPTVDCPTCLGSSPTVVVGSPQAPALPDPWVVPQPDDPPCSVCVVKVKSASSTSSATGAASVLRADAYASFALVSTTITLWNAAGARASFQYDSTALPLEPGRGYEIVERGFESVGGMATTRAYVSMTFKDPVTARAVTVGNEVPVARVLY